ncbi:response regulator [Microbulbifer rhizosphaerae]|uniref:histidine kinase n=1 Tax=Microbulbifer rhizosphaerae TaxID=1562603 RepID=A0A7W4ZBT3_9GAMM|nr:response regulator [Microbulbifer rhizosphaerae]MBB3062635.1 CheY-like chemotaxis protein [Microbulbifer rhizosphaerae]
MKKAIRTHRGVFTYCRARAARLAPAATLLPAAAIAAPLSIPPLHTQVSILWALGLGLAVVVFAVVALLLRLRLREALFSGEARAAELQSDNARLHRQLQSKGRELAACERELGEARDSQEKLRQEKSDLLAITGHRLRQPLDTLLGTLNLLAQNTDGETARLVDTARRQAQTALESLEEMRQMEQLETVELKMPAEQAADSLSILLVESGSHDSLRPALEERGHRVQQQNNGVDGADAALRDKFDLVLLDSTLPLMDGMETARKIRRGAGNELPIFALVTNLRPGDRERYRDQGLNGILPRPVAETQLQQLLAWAARHRRTRPAGQQRARATRLLNADTLCRQRDTLGHLPFAELLGERIANLPKKTTELTSALTGRHWLDAEQQAQAIAANAEEIGLEAAAARLRALVARLAVDGEREYCRHQRTEVLNLMRTSIQQLKAWREKNVRSEWALK